MQPQNPKSQLRTLLALTCFIPLLLSLPACAQTSPTRITNPPSRTTPPASRPAIPPKGRSTPLAGT